MERFIGKEVIYINSQYSALFAKLTNYT